MLESERLAQDQKLRNMAKEVLDSRTMFATHTASREGEVAGLREQVTGLQVKLENVERHLLPVVADEPSEIDKLRAELADVQQSMSRQIASMTSEIQALRVENEQLKNLQPAPAVGAAVGAAVEAAVEVSQDMCPNCNEKKATRQWKCPDKHKVCKECFKEMSWTRPRCPVCQYQVRKLSQKQLFVRNAMHTMTAIHPSWPLPRLKSEIQAQWEQMQVHENPCNEGDGLSDDETQDTP